MLWFVLGLMAGLPLGALGWYLLIREELTVTRRAARTLERVIDGELVL